MNRKAEEEMYGAMPVLDDLDQDQEEGMYGAMPLDETPPAPRKHRHKKT